MTMNANRITDWHYWQRNIPYTVNTTESLETGRENDLKPQITIENSGVTLTIPDPANYSDGVYFDIDATFLSGTATVSSPVTGYSEFAFGTDQDPGTGGDQFLTGTLTVSAMKSLKLKRLTISANPVWKVIPLD